MQKIIEEVSRIVSPVYLVGGSVRDTLLGKIPKDYDFSTPLLPETIEQKIHDAGKKAYLTGKRFGTIGVKVDNRFVEITTFRTETYEEGNRKPNVSFVNDLTTDLSRRDFTINAIAFSDGKLFDPFEGKVDLANSVVRCVGKAKERFKEDPLRMLRAARFAAQLGFVVEEVTLDMCTQLNYKILEVSKERWVGELDRILVSEFPEIGLEILAKTRLLNFILPELSLQVGYDQNSPYHSLDLWEHTKKVVKLVPKDLRWAALLHDVAKPFVRKEKSVVRQSYEITGPVTGRFSTKEIGVHCSYHKHDLLGAQCVLKLAEYLKWSNDRKKVVYDLVLNHMEENSPLRKADLEAK